MQRYLTKSRFKSATECPTKLFYANKIHEYANSMSDNAFLESLADGVINLMYLVISLKYERHILRFF